MANNMLTFQDKKKLEIFLNENLDTELLDYQLATKATEELGFTVTRHHIYNLRKVLGHIRPRVRKVKPNPTGLGREVLSTVLANVRDHKIILELEHEEWSSKCNDLSRSYTKLIKSTETLLNQLEELYREFNKD